MAREPVIRKLVPRRPRVDKDVGLRPELRIVVQGAEPDRDLVPLRPVATEQARAARGAERLHLAVSRSKDADQLLALKQPELLARNASLREAERPGVLAAARAVAVDGDPKRQRHLEANAAAEAAAMDRLSHSLESRPL